jgi:hypothetical protein
MALLEESVPHGSDARDQGLMARLHLAIQR